MRVLSLCSGIGALDLGLERAGLTTVGQVERDPFCQRVLARHWPEVPRHDDVLTTTEWWTAQPDRPTVDVVAGGFPCQPASVAGARRGSADERWLWPGVHHVIDTLRPRFVVLENVPGLLSLRPGRPAGGGELGDAPGVPVGLGAVLGDLAASGYDARWDCIPAAAVGAPHRRDRFWLIAVLADPNGQRRGTRWAGRPARPGDHREDVAPAGLADPDRERRHVRPGTRGHLAGQPEPADRRDPLADPDGESRGRPPWDALAGRGPASAGVGPAQPGRRGDVADPDGAGLDPRGWLGRAWPTPVRDGWWTPEPRMGGTDDGPAPGVDPGRLTPEPWERGTPRLATGIPHQTERLRGLGNAVVPQVAEHVGRILLDLATRVDVPGGPVMAAATT
ncbi:C-5 cytosine-specific DNA methylase [Pseudofrankia inefficax]|uniref:DNA (cytosine-5-)-methyltransferase n=1 Tax=Pseudofrankia inefficax (strain DSM 45817 / CECT 9037 / DDB 130130 / EuI1c) TaxID=298654 RepID=E3JDP9_PSEI1|nr:C-5 cytosine-specific DNA methylase [Pseudofrankia inefficax]